MDRRTFLGIVALLAAPLAAEAQQAGRIFRLGMLTQAAPVPSDQRTSAFLTPAALRELGYVEGRNLVIERRYAEGKTDRLPGLARDLVQFRVEVIVTVGPAAIRAAKDATTSIPTVFFGNFDPVAAGFVASLARPGGNATGVLIAPEGTLAGKKLELLKEMVPRATQIALLAPDDPNFGRQGKEVQKAARRWASSSLSWRFGAAITRAPLPRWWPTGRGPSSSARTPISCATGSASSSWPRSTGCPPSTSGPSKWMTVA